MGFANPDTDCDKERGLHYFDIRTEKQKLKKKCRCGLRSGAFPDVEVGNTRVVRFAPKVPRISVTRKGKISGRDL